MNKLTQTRKLQLIGKGLFSKVYRLNDKQVYIQSTCYAKECISMNWHNSTNIFPVLEPVDIQEYICEYYAPVKSLKKELIAAHYDIYKQLRSLSVGYVKNNYDLLDKWREQFATVTNKKFRHALLDMTDNLCNWGTQINFEISPRNVAVKNGKLILLDVFFFSDQLNEQRMNKKRKIHQ